MDDGASNDLLARLRARLADPRLPLNAKLPAERELSREYGVSRAELRKALDVLEAEGRVWRHVGRGTFVGSRPVLDLDELAFLGELANPAQVMEARLAVEPPLARLAALHGVGSDFERMAVCARRCREAPEWRVYEACDDAFHAAVARATRNKLLVTLFDRLNAVRRATVWGQLRITRLPAPDHASFAEHDAVVAAVRARDADGAEAAMRGHLRSVRDRVLADLAR